MRFFYSERIQWNKEVDGRERKSHEEKHEIVLHEETIDCINTVSLR